MSWIKRIGRNEIARVQRDFERQSAWQRKQDAAAPGRYYGDGGTWHQTERLDVEVDEAGRVVSVWFRCQMIPFEQVQVGRERAIEMRSANTGLPRLTGVELLDEQGTK
jgi:hypothetical protein